MTIMTPFHATVRKLLTPVIYINLCAMLLSGPWLLLKGSLGSIWPAVLGLMISPFLFPVLLLPGAILAGIMNLASKSHPRLADFMTLSSVGYIVILLSLYASVSLRFVDSFLIEPTLIPAAIWGVAGGIAPWAIHASNDRDNIFFTGLVMMMQATAVIVVTITTFYDIGFWMTFLSFWAIMGTMVWIEAGYEAWMLKRKKN